MQACPAGLALRPQGWRLKHTMSSGRAPLPERVMHSVEPPGIAQGDADATRRGRVAFAEDGAKHAANNFAAAKLRQA